MVNDRLQNLKIAKIGVFFLRSASYPTSEQEKTPRLAIFWRKGQDSNLRRLPSLVFKTSAFNHSATFPHLIIP